MVYIRLYEEFHVIKGYVLEFVFDGVYRIYSVRPKGNLFLICLRYIYRDNFLEANIVDDEFLADRSTVLNGVVYQSDSLDDVLEELDILVNMKKYNL